MIARRLLPLAATVAAAAAVAGLSAVLDLSAALTYGIGGAAVCLLVLFGVPTLLNESGWGARARERPRTRHVVVVAEHFAIRVQNGGRPPMPPSEDNQADSPTPVYRPSEHLGAST